MPWREVRDICPEGQNFHDRFQTFYADTSTVIKDRMQNIQYYWQCIDGANKRKEDNKHEESTHTSYRIIGIEDEAEDVVDDEEDQEYENVDGPSHVFTEEDVEIALSEQFSQDERLYANVGMLIADQVGIFRESETECENPIARTATMDDIQQYGDWEKIVLSISKRDKGQEIPDHSAELNPSNIRKQTDEQCDPGVEPYSQKSEHPRAV